MKTFARPRFSLQVSSLKVAMFASVAAVAMLASVPARADDVTPERLLNSDKEPGNRLHHHKN